MKIKLNYDELVKQKVIYLNHQNLQDDDLYILIKVIRLSTVLEMLYLYRNNLTLDDGILTDAIARNNTIKVLNLSDNNISLQGAKHLATAIKMNNTLTQVYIKGNSIGGDEGARSLADALVVNESIYWLDIVFGSTISGDYIVQSLITSLTENLAKKKRINFRGMGLDDDDDDLGMIYDVVEHSTILEDLDFSDNNLTLGDGKLADAISVYV